MQFCLKALNNSLLIAELVLWSQSTTLISQTCTECFLCVGGRTVPSRNLQSRIQDFNKVHIIKKMKTRCSESVGKGDITLTGRSRGRCQDKSKAPKRMFGRLKELCKQEVLITGSSIRKQLIIRFEYSLRAINEMQFSFL